MQEVFYRDTNGRKVSVFVTDEVATAMRDVRREEWGTDAKAHYHNVSLQSLEEAGYQLAETSTDCLESLILREERADKHRRLKQALSTLTPSQRKIVYYLYVKNLSLKEIAEKLGITYQAVQDRRKKILEKLKKFFK